MERGLQPDRAGLEASDAPLCSSRAGGQSRRREAATTARLSDASPPNVSRRSVGDSVDDRRQDHEVGDRLRPERQMLGDAVAVQLVRDGAIDPGLVVQVCAVVIAAALAWLARRAASCWRWVERPCGSNCGPDATAELFRAEARLTPVGRGDIFSERFQLAGHLARSMAVVDTVSRDAYSDRYRA